MLIIKVLFVTVFSDFTLSTTNTNLLLYNNNIFYYLIIKIENLVNEY